MCGDRLVARQGSRELRGLMLLEFLQMYPSHLLRKDLPSGELGPCYSHLVHYQRAGLQLGAKVALTSEQS